MRSALAAFVLLAIIACDSSDRPAGSLLASSGGEVQLADGNSFEFAITSEKYKQWERARTGIDKRAAARFGQLLNPGAPSEASIARAVAYLESEPRAKQSIEAAGMTVRDFVVMTVALEQEMRLASGERVTRASQREPQEYAFPAYDSALFNRRRSDSVPIDTAFVSPRPSLPDTALPPTPPRDTVVRRDTVRRDTVIVRRDTIPAPPQPPPDTLARPDSIGSWGVTADTLRGR